MKLASLALFLFLLGFTTAGFVVVDTDGRPVTNRGEYYILPAIRGRGGGLQVADINDEDCPPTVVQVRYELFYGLPGRFSSQSTFFPIFTNTNLNIEFTKLLALPSCAPEPARWTVLEEYAVEEGYDPVKISDESRFMDSFQIWESGEDFKLVYCLGPGSKESKCIYLSIEIDDDNNRRLVLKDEDPLIVQSKNANRGRFEERSIV